MGSEGGSAAFNSLWPPGQTQCSLISLQTLPSILSLFSSVTSHLLSFLRFLVLDRPCFTGCSCSRSLLALLLSLFLG